MTLVVLTISLTVAGFLAGWSKIMDDEAQGATVVLWRLAFGSWLLFIHFPQNRPGFCAINGVSGNALQQHFGLFFFILL